MKKTFIIVSLTLFWIFSATFVEIFAQVKISVAKSNSPINDEAVLTEFSIKLDEGRRVREIELFLIDLDNNTTIKKETLTNLDARTASVQLHYINTQSEKGKSYPQFYNDLLGMNGVVYLPKAQFRIDVTLDDGRTVSSNSEQFTIDRGKGNSYEDLKTGHVFIENVGKKFSGSPVAAWNLSLSHDEVQRYSKAAKKIAPLLPDKRLGAAVDMAADYVQLVDAIGGNKGINISGFQGRAIITPMNVNVYSFAIRILEETFKKLGDCVYPSDKALQADASNPGDHEKFAMIFLGNGKIAMRAMRNCRGYVAANHNNKMSADRDQIRGWEQFTLVRNDDGTVSFLSHQNYYMSVESETRTVANRERIDNWEKFDLIWHADGTFSLKSRHTGKFVRAS